MEALGVVPAIQNEKGVEDENISSPAYISIDLGLRQKRRHSEYFCDGSIHDMSVGSYFNPLTRSILHSVGRCILSGHSIAGRLL